jgi:hypothetical protein
MQCRNNVTASKESLKGMNLYTAVKKFVSERKKDMKLCYMGRGGVNGIEQ